ATLKAGTTDLDHAVLGIGVNVSPPACGFPDEIAAIAGAVFDGVGDIATLAASILDAFFAIYARLPERGFVDEYRARSLLDGRTVTVNTPSGDRRATALAVDEECCLRVRFENGEEVTLSSGDVSIRW
ncbi:MAG: biotin--[Clostridia bacterium]|nr:biotin--[acetyl-CoA-carboxylase] ligase [Clostridia bacterium]